MNKILVITQDKSQGDSLADRLRTAGYEVAVVTNEDEALIHLINVYSVDINSAFHRISDILSIQNVSNELLEEIDVLKLFFEKIEMEGIKMPKAEYRSSIRSKNLIKKASRRTLLTL